MEDFRKVVESARGVVLGTDDQSKMIRKGILAVSGAYVTLKFLNYVRWVRHINRTIPGPNNDWESMVELKKADLGDFWGFNSTLLTNLHKQHGKVVKLWLGGMLYISFVDCDDIEQLNKKAVGRPALTQNLLPFLGAKNLLFQPTAHDNGAFVKKLRLKFGKLAGGEQPLGDLHRIAWDTMDERTAHWGKGTPIDVFEELKYIIYDIMGKVMFGGAWSDNENGPMIIKTHRFLIEGSASLGLSCCEHATFANFLKLPSDYMKYQSTIKEFHAVCWRMIEQRRAEVKADPAKWEKDLSALTMLVTEQDDNGKPFFDKILAISTCAGFLNGAYDTTHLSTFWLMYNLAKNPESQKKLQAEIDAAFPKKARPSFEACRDLKRLHATIQESIRLRVTVPLGMRGNYREDVKIGNVTVPKSATILPFTQGAHQDPAYFGSDVDTFRPERFMGDSPEAKKACRAFHGFGSGNRMCVGFKFAETELKVLFVYWLQRYTIELTDPNMANPTMLYEAGCQAPKDKFSLIFKPR